MKLVSRTEQQIIYPVKVCRIHPIVEFLGLKLYCSSEFCRLREHNPLFNGWQKQFGKIKLRKVQALIQKVVL